MSNLKSFLHVGALIKYQTKITKPTEMKIEKKRISLLWNRVLYESETCGVRNLVLVIAVLVFLLFVVLLIHFLIIFYAGPIGANNGTNFKPFNLFEYHPPCDCLVVFGSTARTR